MEIEEMGNGEHGIWVNGGIGNGGIGKWENGTWANGKWEMGEWEWKRRGSLATRSYPVPKAVRSNSAVVCFARGRAMRAAAMVSEYANANGK